jgi:hypothetical protein
MFADEFDALTKTLRPETRRGAVRLPAGMPFTGVLTALLPTAERASAKKPGRQPAKKHRPKPG